MIIFFIIVLFFSYFLLCLKESPTYFKYFFLFFYFLISILLRVLVDPVNSKDYDNYYNIVSSSGGDYTQIGFLFAEPYLIGLKSLMFIFWDNPDKVIYAIYTFNLIVSSFFFIWISQIKDITLWKKLLTFSLFFFLFAFTTLRNSAAYFLVTILFYNIQRGRKFRIGYLGFLAHISAIPALLSSMANIKKASLNVLFFLIVVGFGAYYILQSSPLFAFGLAKFDSYSGSDDSVNNIVHKIYFFCILSLSVVLWLSNRKYVLNNVFILLFFTYLIFNAINPVMGFRFSIYLILFLLVFPTIKTDRLIDKALNLTSIMFLGLFIFNYFGTHNT